MSAELYYKSACELSGLLNRREISSVELTQSVIGRTKAVDDLVQAFNSFDEKNALAQAADSDARRNRGCLLYTSPSPRDGLLSRMPSSA